MEFVAKRTTVEQAIRNEEKIGEKLYQELKTQIFNEGFDSLEDYHNKMIGIAHEQVTSFKLSVTGFGAFVKSLMEDELED